MNKKSEYSQLLRDPRWQKKRLEIMERDEFSCLVCYDTESTLNVHHCHYMREAVTGLICFFLSDEESYRIIFDRLTERNRKNYIAKHPESAARMGIV